MQSVGAGAPEGRDVVNNKYIRREVVRAEAIVAIIAVFERRDT
jgi:hypothetical protein